MVFTKIRTSFITALLLPILLICFGQSFKTSPTRLSVCWVLRLRAITLLRTSRLLPSSSIRSNALAWRSVRPAEIISSCSSYVSLKSRSLLAMVDWVLPSLWAASSWVSPNLRISLEIPRASSNTPRSLRCRFSRRAKIADSLSEHLTIMHGTFLSPAITDARRRRSPAISSYSLWLALLTVSGCKIPFSVMDCDNDVREASSNCFRGWALLGRILIIGI